MTSIVAEILGCFICALVVPVIRCDRRFADNKEIHDEVHIKQHLEDKIDVAQLSEDQRRFHYFSMADLNKDNRIDGIEIIKAISHIHEGGTGPGKPIKDEDDAIETVDSVLKEMDINGDGYIEFTEYMMRQKVLV